MTIVMYAIYIYVTRWLQQWFIPGCLVSGVTTLGGLRWNLADVELEFNRWPLDIGATG